MTNQIKKLYENVGLDNLWVERYDSNGIEHENWYPSYKVMIKSMMEKNDWTLKEAQNVAKKECHKELLPFTAEKQIELIKWLMCKKQTIQVELRLYENDYYISHITECEHNDAVEYVETGRKNTFDEALANLVSELWQDLTEEEKQQVKGILC